MHGWRCRLLTAPQKLFRYRYEDGQQQITEVQSEWPMMLQLQLMAIFSVPLTMTLAKSRFSFRISREGQELCPSVYLFLHRLRADMDPSGMGSPPQSLVCTRARSDVMRDVR
ncbi:Protein of unknown function [Pyronema omphalodes CBS 100304]|uniref:Uncharacterized protein n=1 Tax=Pyronema omphalodes (strain CBS 100304) TaxID=1076935 RepID=U4L1Y0_PYROM|nr:Protein of unknown function [Pyronema omphalodes CBS 100304]